MIKRLPEEPFSQQAKSCEPDLDISQRIVLHHIDPRSLFSDRGTNAEKGPPATPNTAPTFCPHHLFNLPGLLGRHSLLFPHSPAFFISHWNFGLWPQNNLGRYPHVVHFRKQEAIGCLWNTATTTHMRNHHDGILPRRASPLHQKSNT